MLTSTTQRQRRQTKLALERLEARDCPAYSIVDLLPATGSFGTTSEARSVNDSGLAVGTSMQVSGYPQATVWEVASGSTRIGAFLPMFPGDNYSEASGVNNSGMIVGQSGVVGVARHGVVWIGAAGSYTVHDLGTLGGIFTDDGATGISQPDTNSVTWVSGMSTYDPGSGYYAGHPTIWRIDANGNTLSTIDLEPVGFRQAWANDVRVVGSMVYVAGGYTANELTGDSMARVWTLDLAGNIVSRTDLAMGGATWTDGGSINKDGHAAGNWLKATDGLMYGFINRNGVMTNLGSLGNRGSIACAINDSDTVVGFYRNYTKGDIGSNGQPYAFVRQAGTMRDLRGQISGSVRSVWTRLFYAFDVNATGQIVGQGSVKKGGRYEQHGYLVTPSALQADAMGKANSVATIASEQTQPLLKEALSRWQAAGFDTSALRGVDLRITDLGGTTLGLASGNTIWLDDNAAGWGWFVDRTPRDDSEFLTPGNQGERNRMDLLTVLEHEIGHVLGYDHEESGVMIDTLPAGARRLPGSDVSFSDLAQIDWVSAAEQLLPARQRKK